MSRPSRPLLRDEHPELYEELVAAQSAAQMLELSEVTGGSARQVLWACRSCSHCWPARVSARTAGSGCPKCAERARRRPRRKSLAQVRPDLVPEWDQEANGELTPEAVGSGSARKVGWICARAGHRWSAVVSNRAKGAGCPDCRRERTLATSSLQSTRPDLVSEWDHDRNGALEPRDVMASSTTTVWWVCPECHQPWQVSVLRRARGARCIHCRPRPGLLKDERPDLAREWDPG